MPSATQDGLTINRSGQAPVRASLSARQAKAAGLMTSGTCGLTSIGSLASADLSTSLASKLQAVTQMRGSTLYKLTWKQWVTPSGLSRSRLRASARRTSAIERTGWPTPTANAGTGAGIEGRQGGMNIQSAAMLAGWPSPMASDGNGGKGPRKGASITGRMPDGSKASMGLNAVAKLALTGWPTPTTIDNNQVRGEAAAANAPQRGTTIGGAARLAGWPTPQAIDSNSGVRGSSSEDKKGWGSGSAIGRKLPQRSEGCALSDIQRPAIHRIDGANPDATNGFWRNADWLFCRDEKWWPVRPGSFPLANGVTARVGRLRAYGNAINAEAAKIFIAAYMEVQG